MKANIKTKRLKIKGMTCVNCENKIEKQLSRTAGIIKSEVSYNKGSVEITYDSERIKLSAIIRIIEKLDYQVIGNQEKSNQEFNIKNILGVMFIILALSVMVRWSGVSNLFNAFPQAEEGMGYGMLFLIGVLTSVHCVAMCGGINLSQCLAETAKSTGDSRFSMLRPSILYNLGRVISYTLIGGLVGALGSVVSFTGKAMGLVQIVAGIFMVIMGLNMLNIFPWLRRFNLRMPKVFARKINAQKRGRSSLLVGLLNGLMPCGPLQAMQLYALSTGDPVKGALSMFLFSLGTVPLMFGLGALSSILSQKFTKRVMSVGAVLVVILGVSMLNSGLSLSGNARAFASLSGGKTNQAERQEEVQVVTTSLNSGRYEPITVQAGIPVKWTINVENGTINGCNYRLIINEYGIEKELQVGENIIEFTPTQIGTFGYSCWMGMIRSTITVTGENGETLPAAEPEDIFEGGCCSMGNID